VSLPTPAKVETVRLPEQPTIKPAVPDAKAPTQVASAPQKVIADPPVRNQEKKRGFFQSINPLNLFTGDTAQEGATQAQSAAAQPASAAPEDQSSQPQSAAGPRHWPKYTYRKPVVPPGRNRATAERVFAEGVKAQSAHRLEEAVQAYRKAIQMDPSYFEAHYNLGLAQAALGQLAGALASYEDALAIEPQSLDARYNFALTLRQANYIPDAVAEFKKVIKTYPNEARAHLALGNLYSQHLNEPALARTHYLKVLQVEPRHPQAAAIRYWLAANPR
jgi:tetratricopeptide (TPR) repeat protein